MQKQAFSQLRKKVKGFKFKNIVPIPFVEWTDYNDEVKIEFHREIMPYLTELDKYTQYAITDIRELNSKYSIILYKWLTMYYNQYQTYLKKGERTQKQLYEYKNPIIRLVDLREITDTITEYKDMNNFTKEGVK